MPPATASVTVVIVNFNGGSFLQECLEAITEQEVHADQIILVDNNSSDGSVDHIESDYSQIQLIKSPVNLGFAGGNNLAIKTVQNSEWIALLNPDTVPPYDWIKRIKSAINTHKNTQMFSCRLVKTSDQNCIDGTGDIYHVSGLVWRRDHGNTVKKQRLPSEIVFSPCGAAAIIQLKTMNAAGLFDESYFCYNEDIDLAFRMRLIGASCIHLDDCEVKHVGSAITGLDSDFAIYHGHRNLVWTFFKNMPSRLFWRYLPQHILLNICTIIYYSLKGRGKIIIKAKYDAFKQLPRILKQRREIQKNRTLKTKTLLHCMNTRFFAPYSRNEK